MDGLKKPPRPEKLGREDREPERHDDAGGGRKNNECYAEHEDAQAEHGDRDLPAPTKPGTLEDRIFSHGLRGVEGARPLDVLSPPARSVIKYSLTSIAIVR